jgi:WD40 repeat protein
MTIYNIDSEKGLTHYRDTQREQFDASKIEFTPSGNEILSGSLSLKIFDITKGGVVSEFGRSQKAISSITYVNFAI